MFYRRYTAGTAPGRAQMRADLAAGPILRAWPWRPSLPPRWRDVPRLRPPTDVQAAIRTIRRQLPPYVAEANRALGEARHPDAERLQGIGERLARAVEALDRWASGERAPTPGPNGAPSPTPGDTPR